MTAKEISAAPALSRRRSREFVAGYGAAYPVGGKHIRRRRRFMDEREELLPLRRRDDPRKPRAWHTATEIYECYQRWCVHRGLLVERGQQNAFGRTLSRLDRRDQRTTRRRRKWWRKVHRF